MYQYWMNGDSHESDHAFSYEEMERFISDRDYRSTEWAVKIKSIFLVDKDEPELRQNLFD
jgi:hypothetical protein